MSNGKTFQLSSHPTDRVTVAPSVGGLVSLTVNDPARVAMAHLTPTEAIAIAAELVAHAAPAGVTPPVASPSAHETPTNDEPPTGPADAATAGHPPREDA